MEVLYCAYVVGMYVVYFRAYIVFVHVQPLRRFHHCSRFDHFCRVMLCPLPYLCPSIPYRRLFTGYSSALAVPLSQTFATFISNGFKTVLSWLIVRRIYLHRLPYFVRLYSLICGKFAVLGVG